MTPEELRAELAEGRIRPVYLVVGPEALLRDESLAALREAALEGRGNDFDEERLDGDRLDPSALRNAIGTLPVLAPRRLVVLREPEAGRGRGGLAETLSDVLGELEEGGGTVLAVVAAKVDGRARWVRALGPATVRCEPPRGRALLAFLREEARRQGVALEPEAAALLAERTGPQLLALRQEVAKAGLFAGAGEPVTREHVAAATSDVADEPIWDLTDAIGEGRTGEALALLGRLLRAGAAPPQVLGALAGHFRKLVRARHGERVPGPPFAVRKLDQQARRLSAARLLSGLRAIHRTDLALKGAGGLSPELALERLILALAR